MITSNAIANEPTVNPCLSFIISPFGCPVVYRKFTAAKILSVKAGIKIAAVVLVLLFCVSAATAQDDVTTQHGSSGPDGAWITGPASNPLSFLNGPAYRTFASAAPYRVRDFQPVSLLNQSLPKWIAFEAEERLRFESYQDGGFAAGNHDSYILNRFRYQMDLRPNTWLKFVTQVQDTRPFFQKPPIGVPNENTWDLKLAYLEAGDPERQWVSVRFGRQLINYNNTIIANSEWRDQGRSYDALATNLHFGRFRAGIFTAYPVITRDAGLSRHEKDNSISGVYGRLTDVIPQAVVEPFVLQRKQPNVSGARQSETALGIRLKGKIASRLDYSSGSHSRKRLDWPRIHSILGRQFRGGLHGKFSALAAAIVYAIRLCFRRFSARRRHSSHLRHNVSDRSRSLRDYRSIRLAKYCGRSGRINHRASSPLDNLSTISELLVGKGRRWSVQQFRWTHFAGSFRQIWNSHRSGSRRVHMV